MDIKHILGLTAALLSIINISLYIRTVVQGKTRPHAFSWLLWTAVMVIVAAAQVAGNGGAGSWQTAVSGGMCFIVGILALFRGERKGTRSDWVSIALAFLAIPLWLVTHNPLSAVILLTIMDGMGFYPTFRKSYHAPFQESVSWTFRATASYAVAVLALEHYSLTTLLYPLMMIMLHAGLGVMLIWRRRVVQK